MGTQTTAAFINMQTLAQNTEAYPNCLDCFTVKPEINQEPPKKSINSLEIAAIVISVLIIAALGISLLIWLLCKGYCRCRLKKQTSTKSHNVVQPTIASKSPAAPTRNQVPPPGSKLSYNHLCFSILFLGKRELSGVLKKQYILTWS